MDSNLTFNEVKLVWNKVIPDIRENIKVCELLHYLHDFFATSSIEKVLAQDHEHGQIHATDQFFGEAKYKPSSFPTILAALKQINQPDILITILKVVIKELKPERHEYIFKKLREAATELSVNVEEEIRAASNRPSSQGDYAVSFTVHAYDVQSNSASPIRPRAEVPMQNDPNPPVEKAVSSENNEPEIAPDRQSAAVQLPSEMIYQRDSTSISNKGIPLGKLNSTARKKISGKLQMQIPQRNQPVWEILLDEEDLDISVTETEQIEKSRHPGKAFYDQLMNSGYTTTDLINMLQRHDCDDAAETVRQQSTKEKSRHPGKAFYDQLMNSGYTTTDLINMLQRHDCDDAAETVRQQSTKGKSKIDEKTLQIYLKALDEGEEQLKHIRLMVVGMFGVGKTSLVRRLQGESIEGVKSTVCIDVNVKKCALDEDGTWINQESKDSRFDARLTDVLVKSETTAQEGQLKMDQSSQPALNPKSPGPSSQQLEKSKNAFEDLCKTDEGKEYTEMVQAATSKKSCAGIKPTISIWDFAGQSVYYSTHPFFLSSRSIYLLVLDISKPLDSKVKEEREVNPSLNFGGSMKKDYTCLDAFKFWVSSIYTQYKVETGKQYQPTIVLVGTHGDKLNGDPKEKERQKDDYFDEAREHFDATSVAKLFHPRTFLVSCSDDADDVFNDLKANITEIAKEQPHWNSNTPAKWIPLERSIEYEKRKSKELMKFSEVAVADKENEYNLNDEHEIKQFLQVQHSFGNAIYFDAKYLDRTIIFDPQWLINIFKQCVTHRPSVPNELRNYWIDYKKTAKLHKKLLDYITKPDEKGEKDNKVNEGSDAVRYMEHLGVIAKPVSEEDVDFHIVPCMLKQLMPVDYENKIKDLVNPEEGKSTYVLCFAFNDGYLLPSVFHRLLATYIKKNKIKRRGRELFVYNGFGAFELTSTKTLCIWYADFIIFARVTLHDKKNDILLTDECINIRKELSDTITKILQLHQKNQAGSLDSNEAVRTDPFKEHVLCEKAFLNNELTVLQSTNTIGNMFGLYEVEKMKPFTDCNCCDSVRKGHVIEREIALRYWFEEPHYLKEISKWFEEPEDGDLMQLSGIVNVAEFRELGRRLNIPDGSIQQIQRSNSHHQLQVHELLQQWYKVDNGHNNLKLKQILFKLKENMEDRRAARKPAAKKPAAKKAAAKK